MRAKLDENLPVEAAELLRAAGWNCDTVHDEGLGGHVLQMLARFFPFWPCIGPTISSGLSSRIVSAYGERTSEQ